MKPDVWGRALDDIAVDQPTLLVPTPAGQPFTQAIAAQLAEAPSTWCSPAAGTRASTSG